MSVGSDIQSLKAELEAMRREHLGWHESEIEEREEARKERRELRAILLGDGVNSPGFVGRLDRLEQSANDRQRMLRILTAAFIPVAANAVWMWVQRLNGGN